MSAEPEDFTGIEMPPRSPLRAALSSALFCGLGQLYNRQLDKAILIWIWSFIVFGSGLLLLLIATLTRMIPPGGVRPPLGDWLADHGSVALGVWVAAAVGLWVGSVADAHRSAEKINRGEVRIRHSLRWQLVHVLGSQLLGLIPVIGFLFPPGLVAEALDAARERRRPDSQRLIREGGQALVEWAATRAALYAFWIFLGVWVLWWILRALRLAP